jgi:hypothetical protein
MLFLVSDVVVNVRLGRPSRLRAVSGLDWLQWQLKGLYERVNQDGSTRMVDRNDGVRMMIELTESVQHRVVWLLKTVILWLGRRHT